MIPSRGLARAKPGLAFQNQILSRAPVRSIPRQAISRPTLSSSRQFGTSIRGNGNSNPRASTIGFLSGSRIGATSLLSSPSFLVSNRRFASTESTTSPTATHQPEFSSFTDFDAPSIFNVPEGPGYLNNLGLDFGYGPTALVQWVVEHLHFTMGLGWLGAIVGGSLAIRAVMAYPAFLAQLESFKSQRMRADPVYQDRQQKFMLNMARGGNDAAEMMQLRMQIKHIREQYGVKMGRMFLPMLQLPLAYGMFKLTRAMALLPVPGLDSAGALWFPDLTVADPLYILPCVGSVMMYLTVKRSLPFMAAEQAKMMKMLPWILGPIGFVVSLSFPAAVQVYFAATALLTYWQTTLLHNSLVRKWTGLPPLDQLTVNPEYMKKPPVNPFVNMKSTYQAPRTVDTTATEQKPEEKKEGLKSPFAMFREARKGMTDTIEKYTSDPEKSEREAALKYEKQRRQEENDRYMARKARAEMNDTKK
ncbi:hypothetical protein N0V82_001527 [Gnomoniopsis sp. IMI 355080]|nr:hypothetical protein N0V82_001527 [Gnomoniopsis sp. IMI 355080]